MAAPHVIVYRLFFGIWEQSQVLSELSWQPATGWIHHILTRGRLWDDNIENLIALTKKEHDQAHGWEDPFLSFDYLMEKHRVFMENHLRYNS